MEDRRSYMFRIFPKSPVHAASRIGPLRRQYTHQGMGINLKPMNTSAAKA